MKQGLSELVFIIDKSGSMSGLEDDTVGGFNAFVSENKKVEGEAVLTTVLFDTAKTMLHDRVDLAEVKPLERTDYRPGGCTALLDAVGETLEHIARVQRYMPDEYKPEKTIVAITTDGHENASTRYTYDQVKHMIEERQGKDGWEFLFLGANIDVAAEAGRLGIPPGAGSDLYGKRGRDPRHVRRRVLCRLRLPHGGTDAGRLEGWALRQCPRRRRGGQWETSAQNVR